MSSAFRSSIGTLACAVAACPSTVHADFIDAKPCVDSAEEGQKLRDTGAYRRARGRFIACAAAECPGEVRKSCVAWLMETERLMPTVVFAARMRGREVTEARVTVDDEVAVQRIDGKPVALDPGEHHFRFELFDSQPGQPGSVVVEEVAVIRAGEKGRIVDAEIAGTPPSDSTPRDAAGSPPTGASPPPSIWLGPSRSPVPRAAPTAATYALSAFALGALSLGAVMDLSGYVFLQQCGGDLSCSPAHERAEVGWRFVTGDILLGAGFVSAMAAWISWSRDARASRGHVPSIAVGVSARDAGATVRFTGPF